MTKTALAVPNLATTNEQSKAIRQVILGAALGTVLEWYDFYLYASLATYLAKNFFSGLDPTTAFFFALVTFAVGFMVRPAGALIFGRIGDRAGRKITFLVTVVLMGISTIAVGLIPTYATLGMAAPVLLITVRMLQGIALGGAYGGATTYVAEHSAPSRRALSTSFIALTGTVGLLLCFLVIFSTRSLMGDQFDVWGWRVPFLLSILIVPVSLIIRFRLQESPAFTKLKKENRSSRAPFKEAFGNWDNLKKIITAFFMCSGMTCIYYTATIFPIYFLTNTLKVASKDVNFLMLCAAAIGIPLFIAIGWLCDRIGKKPVLLVAYVLTAALLFPIFKAFTHVANPALDQAQSTVPIILEAPLAECGFLFNPTGTANFTAPCDVAKRALAEAGLSYKTTQGPAGRVNVRIGGETVTLAGTGSGDAAFKVELRKALLSAGYPSIADPKRVNFAAIFGLMVALYICAALVVTPMGPSLVEMFPTRIRYTSMGVPYNVATGFVGGLLPSVIFAVSAQWGNIYAGLWYPMVWTLLAAGVCLVCNHETRNVDLSSM